MGGAAGYEAFEFMQRDIISSEIENNTNAIEKLKLCLDEEVPLERRENGFLYCSGVRVLEQSGEIASGSHSYSADVQTTLTSYQEDLDNALTDEPSLGLDTAGIFGGAVVGMVASYYTVAFFDKRRRS